VAQQGRVRFPVVTPRSLDWQSSKRPGARGVVRSAKPKRMELESPPGLRTRPRRVAVRATNDDLRRVPCRHRLTAQDRRLSTGEWGFDSPWRRHSSRPRWWTQRRDYEPRLRTFDSSRGHPGMHARARRRRGAWSSRHGGRGGSNPSSRTGSSRSLFARVMKLADNAVSETAAPLRA